MNTLDIWENAVPLAQAYVHFAPPDEAQKFRSLIEQVSLPKIVARLQERVASGERDPGILARSLGPNADRDALRDKLKARCLEYVGSGRLRAFGFAVPRKADDVPVEVPSDLWQGMIRWDRSSIEAHGFRIEGVRLIPTAWIEQLKVKRASSEPLQRRGRPSRKAQIVEAYDTLDSTGEIDHAQPLKQAIRQIRKWILASYPDDPAGEKGLGDQAIANIVGERFQAGKARPKTIKSD